MKSWHVFTISGAIVAAPHITSSQAPIVAIVYVVAAAFFMFREGV
jgi:hypothetical protein